MSFITIEATWYCHLCRDKNKHNHDDIHDREELYTKFGEIMKHIIDNPSHAEYVEMYLRDTTSD